MRPSAELRKIVGVLERVVAKTTTGTAAQTHITTRVDLARDRAEDRAGGHLPREGTNGGSSSPQEADERKERELVCRQAELDYFDIAILVHQLAADANELERIVNRQAEVVHESKLPMDVLPGCDSCARYGHFEKVDEHRPGFHLCRWCREFQLSYGQLPPKEAVELRHRESANAAGRWIARNPALRDAAAKIEVHRLECKLPPEAHEELDRCATTFTDMTARTEFQCIRPQGHDGEHRGVRDGQSFPFPVSVP